MARSLTFAAEVTAPGLLAQARAETGLADFGGDDFSASLESFVKVLSGADRLSPDERWAAAGQMVAVLAGRLRMVADRARYPGIADERIVAPMIVVGFPRSGTTLLHALLAAAPGNRAPVFWEIARPSPPPGLAGPSDARIGAGTRDVEQWLAGWPGFIAQHPYFDAGGLTPMECEALAIYDLRNAYPSFFTRVPFGQHWAEAGDDHAYYAWHRRMLQQLQFGQPNRRWVLKGVEHQFRLSALLAAYPDALLVWPHREPVEVFGSLLAVTNMVLRYSGTPEPADRRALSLGMLGSFEDRVARALADPAIDSPSVCHIAYPDLVTDPVAVVRAVYEFFRLDPAGVEPAVRAWLDDPGNRPDRFGKWTYNLADHQVTPDEVRDRFAAYRHRFGV